MKQEQSFYRKENYERWECKGAYEKRGLKDSLKYWQEIKQKLKADLEAFNDYTSEMNPPQRTKGEVLKELKETKEKIKEIREKLKYFGTAY